MLLYLVLWLVGTLLAIIISLPDEEIIKQITLYTDL